MVKKLSEKYSQKPLDHTKSSATDVLTDVSKRENQKAAEATGNLIGNKIEDKVTKFWRMS